MTSDAAVSDVRIGRVERLHQIQPSWWDSLSGAGCFYMCHDWLSYVEREVGVNAGYLTATSARGLVGALPLYASTGETYGNYQTANLIDGRVQGQFLIAGTCRAYVNDVLLADIGQQADTTVLSGLLDTADSAARALGRDGVAFLYLTTPAARRILRVRDDLVPLLLGIDTELEIPRGEGFEAYLSALGKKKAINVRKEAADFAAAGYQVAVEKLSQCWHEMGPLVAQVQRKYGNPDTVESCRASLRMQSEILDRRTLVFTVRRNGELVACALFYAWRDTLYGRVVGFNYESLSNAAEYFNVYFYEPVRYACEHGYRCLRLGQGSYFAKFRRGAQPRALWAIFTSARAQLSDWRSLNEETQRSWRNEWRFSSIDVPPGWVIRG